MTETAKAEGEPLVRKYHVYGYVVGTENKRYHFHQIVSAVDEAEAKKKAKELQDPAGKETVVFDLVTVS